MDEAGGLRVVLVHDWLTGMRGGEKCLEVLCRLFPRAVLFSLLHRPGSVSPVIERLQPRSSFLQFFPGVHRYYRYLLPLMPLAARWRLPPCDLVLSFSHCVAKAACPPAGVPHVCYCFTPMRYAWHMRDSYLSASLCRARWLLEPMLDRIRDWDRRTSQRVSHFLASSRTVQRRIAECYGRASRVLYPPVDTDFFCPAPLAREDYYLVVSALVPYKRIDLAVLACNRLRRRLVVLGSGPEEKKLRALAGPTVHFLGWQADETVRDHLRRCRALLFPGEEDFGIVPVEAQACGTPVVAFGKGGATETVVPLPRGGCPSSSAIPPTGLWLDTQDADCLAQAMGQLEKQAGDLDPRALRRQALRFNPRRFSREFRGFLQEVGKKKTAGEEPGGCNELPSHHSA